MKKSNRRIYLLVNNNERSKIKLAGLSPVEYRTHSSQSTA
ncbi:IS3 family transposase [Bacillus sp. OV322]